MMTPTKENYWGTMGSPMISFMDLSMINEHYYCKRICIEKRTKTKCENGGFPHPRDCGGKCICPGGYGGTLCDERPNDLGAVLYATSEWQHLYMTHYNLYKDIDYLKRTYWIKPNSTSPEKVSMEVKMTLINKNLDVGGCVFAGVEIKTNEDKTLTGHRLCSPKDLGGVLKSPCNYSKNSSHIVPVIFYAYNRPEIMIVAKLEYHYVPC
ncbi:hypothetical protein Y032_0372g154 [Ancylostoma ceylanicum]|nr:hypothetical protein Y032_0372g154 [Ancylostoma ceylanicum]